MSGRSIQVALASTLFDSLAKLPHQIHSKVNKFIRHFLRQPDSSGINRERVKGSQNLYSVRIDQDYRGITVQQDGSVVLLHVDKHDKAYAWARRHRLAVNPGTGAVQIFAAQSATDPAPAPASDSTLAQMRDRNLLQLGIPQPLLDLARSISDTAHLERIESQFPADARRALYMMLSGYTLEEALDELQEGQSVKEDVDPDNIGDALEHPGSQAEFWVVKDEEELAGMLKAPQEKWRVFLHPSQRRLVDRPWNGPVRVLGGAGTGKTVVAMHRAKWLAAHHAVHPGDRILVLTFTANLANDLRNNLRQLIPRDEHFQRLEVVHLDRWVYRFLRQHDFPQRIVYDTGDDRVREAWDQALQAADAALALPERFYQDEWDKVVLAKGVASQEAYLRVSRRGRGTPLSRPQRARIWPVFAAYRAQLRLAGLMEKDDAYRAARNIIEAQDTLLPHVTLLPYVAVVVDEAQDFGHEAFRLIQVLAHGPRAEDRDPANRLFLVGDAHQRIYDRQVVLSHCGIQVRGRSHRLRINYRTSEPILRAAVSVLEGVAVDDLDGGTDTFRGYRSLFGGPDPELRRHDSFGDALQDLTAWVEEIKQEHDYRYEDFCFVTRTTRLRDLWRDALQQQGMAAHIIEGREIDVDNRSAVHLATVHRVKGLEFSAVVLLDVDSDNYPLASAVEHATDKGDRELCLQRERSLLHVAMSRAKRHLLLCTHSDDFSDFLQHLPKGPASPQDEGQ